jgi:hypothetical protein
MWSGEMALQRPARAGFGEVVTKKLPHDFQNNFIIRKQPDY